MERTQNKQTGFSIVELLVVIVAIAVIGAGGWLAYQRNHVQVTGAAPAGQPSNTAPTETTTANLDIKEWGIHLPLDSTTASLYYFIDPKLPNVAYLSLKSISDIAPNCAANKFSLAAISRLTPTEHETALSDPTKGNPGTLHIGDYWYGYQKAQADCIGANPDTQSAVSKAAPNYNGSTLQTTFNATAADSSTN